MTNEERANKISLLQRIAAGELSPEALRPKQMVHRIFAPNSGQQNGLYVNGKRSNDPDDLKAFKTAFVQKKVKVVRK